MEQFTQKYAIVQLIKPLQTEVEFSATEWPLHVTVADVFSIECSGNELLRRLELVLRDQSLFSTCINDDAWFGDDASVHVMLLENIPQLQVLHSKLLIALRECGVQFNHPGYTENGFRPHVTIRNPGDLQYGERVRFHELTLIDMFPDNDPYRRRAVGSVSFAS